MVKRKYYQNDFDKYLDKMKYRDDVVNLRKMLMKDLYDPANRFKFRPEISEKSKEIAIYGRHKVHYGYLVEKINHSEYKKKELSKI